LASLYARAQVIEGDDPDQFSSVLHHREPPHDFLQPL